MKRNRVFVWGSCVSRDTFEHFQPGDFDLIAYVARQSALSAYSKPVELVAPPKFNSPFQQRMVRGDFESNLRHELAAVAKDVDLLLVDLADERLGVYLLPDGSVITRSVELIRSGAESSLPRGTHFLRFGSERHLEYWTTAIATIGRLVQQIVPHAGVALLDIPWAETNDQGQPTPSSFGLTPTEANRIFPAYIDAAQRALNAFRVSLDERVVSSPRHPWGDAPFHYSQGVYLGIVQSLTGRRGRSLSIPSEGETTVAPSPVTQRPDLPPAKPTNAADPVGQDLSETDKLRGNQLAAINFGLRSVLGGEWKSHWIWQQTRASVHEFAQADAVFAFDIVILGEHCIVQLFPRDHSRAQTMREALKGRGHSYGEVPAKPERVDISRHRISGGVVDDQLVTALAASIVRAREALEAPSE